nr:tail fiber domain-containing protein [bacterium]
TTAPSYNLHVNGSVAGTSGYNNLSDARYKKNISSIENASELVSKMRGVSFDWKKEDYKNLNFEDKRQLGLIAQELEEILPEAVSTDNEGYKSIAYSKIIPVLIEAIKEQQKTIDLLKIEIEKIK